MKYAIRKTYLDFILGIRYFLVLGIRYSVLATIVLPSLLFPVEMSAIGVSASPATLSFKALLGKETAAKIMVRNPSSEVGLFEVYPEEFDSDFTIVPSRFVLEAGEKREVFVRVVRREEGMVRTVLAIEGSALGASSLGIGGGVRIPVSIEVSPSSLLAAVPKAAMPVLWMLLGALTLLGLTRRVSLSTLKRLFAGGTLTK
ncbi:MAG: hypothetical protein Q7R88_01430 [bacterium]|nr:hypothetical protein [bacterium]